MPNTKKPVANKPEPGKKPASKTPADTAPPLAAEATSFDQIQGNAGELHQIATSPEQSLTTNHGAPVADDQNSLKAGPRGPTLLEDFVLREKITHFDHERIPERIVHARGSGAHGIFVPYGNCADLTCAAFLQDAQRPTPVFVRFSTVAGGAGSVDLPRDVRGFAVKFYTEEGNFDLVGNNIPVFFIQDAMKFPDLVHAVKMEPDRGFPQAASAHDTFWDFVSLMPESMHMLMWAMSDRAIPRSLRMIEGFGVHTFRLIDAAGAARFVKFHWRPLLGAQSVIWDEACKINAADPDFHRRDLWSAIDAGDFPEWELSVQVFDEAFAAKFEFDVLDATKLIPEEVLPLRPLGRMTLNRNPDNFFAETEQAAFHPGHLVRGIDVSEDPLLQGRLFSYIDTQLSRLGGPNFEQLPINRPQCPMRNFQRDGHMQMDVPKGRVNYEPNSLDPSGPREDPTRGFVSHGAPVSSARNAAAAGVDSGGKTRLRPESFADHYSQARMFFRSMSEPEQRHIISAFAFELAKVATVTIRRRMLGHLAIIDDALSAGVEDALGMVGQAQAIVPARQPIDLAPSPALSLVDKAVPTLLHRKVGVLVTDGVDGTLIESLRTALAKEGCRMEIVAPKISGAKTDGGDVLAADHALSGGASVCFDAVVVTGSEDGMRQLCAEAAAIDWVRDAFGHLKVIGVGRGASLLLDKAGIGEEALDEGLVGIAVRGGVNAFVAAAKTGRIWAREPKLRSPG